MFGAATSYANFAIVYQRNTQSLEVGLFVVFAKREFTNRITMLISQSIYRSLSQFPRQNSQKLML